MYRPLACIMAWAHRKVELGKLSHVAGKTRMKSHERMWAKVNINSNSKPPVQ